MTSARFQPQSIWLATSPKTQYPALSSNMTVDVAVLGGGIVGITVGYLLSQAKLKVAILEAQDLVTGVTGHTTAKITSNHSLIYDYLIANFGQEKAQLYADANQQAIEFIAQTVERNKIYCHFFRNSAFTYTESPERVQELEKEFLATEKLKLPVSFHDHLHLPFSTQGAIEFSHQAQFHPRKYLLALAEEITKNGSRVFTNTRALDIQEGKPHKIETNQGTLKAKQVIIATHFPFYDQGHFYTRLFPYRSYAMAARIQTRIPPGMYYELEHASLSLRPFTSLTDSTWIIGGQGHKAGQADNTVKCYKQLEREARHRLAIKTIAYRWSTQDNETPDRVPYIGKQNAKSETIFVATGFGGWGMTQGTVAGLLLADLIQGKVNPWAELYDPSRFKPIASAKTLIKETINVAKNLIGGNTSLPDDIVDTLGQLPRNEGEVITTPHERLAVYKDQDGSLHALSAVCTHMGCIVKWNRAERSWDCPCHGSRFDRKGQVLHGPAIQNLEVRKI